MIDYGTVYSSVKPEKIKIDDFSVWVSEGITEQVTEDETLYVFNQKRYTKDEYICVLREENDALNNQLTDTQLALCELYEMMI